MGLDPGYRNGCKVAVVDGTGKVLDTAVIYPTFGGAQAQGRPSRPLKQLVRKHGVRHIAIGNGTASRETEQMTAELIRELDCPVSSYMVVSEAGASVLRLQAGGGGISRVRLSTCAAPCPSPGGSRTPWRSW